MPKVATTIALTLLAVSGTRAEAQLFRQPTKKLDIFSQTSIEKAWKQATTKHQPMLVMFTSDNCLYCKKMLAETYGHPTIKKLLAGNTQTVLAHADDYEGLVKKLGIRGYPSTILISAKGDVLDVMEGFLPPKDFYQRVHPLLQAQSREVRAQVTAKQTTKR